MDKIREEFQKWYNRRFANGNPDPEAIQHGQEDMFEAFQAATAEAEKYREALQEIYDMDTDETQSATSCCVNMKLRARQALQKD